MQADDPREEMASELAELVAFIEAQLDAVPIARSIVLTRAQAVTIVGSLNAVKQSFFP